ncbi:MAG: GTP cyclohydrolase II [Pseudomonadota bacterium]
MTLLPSGTELIARARADMRMGVPIMIDGRLVFAAETLNADRLSTLQLSGADITLAITSWRAQTLKARAYDGDIARIIVPEDAPLAWIHAIVDPADDLNAPMKGPLKTARDGKSDTERAAIQLTKTARLMPAVLTVAANGLDTSVLTHLDLDMLTTELANSSALSPVVSAKLPLEVSEAGRLHVFRPDDGGEEHYAVEIGRPSRSEPVLTRLHSACFTGDLLGSLKCDCGPQLRGALSHMGQEGHGVLLYLNQEGRGIGLANKMRAYSLQDQGFDTVEANHRLGFEDDERDFRIGAELLRSMGFKMVRLLTNNPRKVDMLNACGLDVVERVPLKVGTSKFNVDYLATKAAKSGHLL